MASPVIINSSSPNSLRLPTITPPSRRGDGKKPTSSSPGLPSPSEFTRPSVLGLKSGSRAQAVPAQAGFGFATAGSLWRENRFGDDVRRDEEQQKESQVAENKGEKVVKKKRPQHPAAEGQAPTGKLKKPKKATRDGKKVAAELVGCNTLEFQDYVCADVVATSSKAPTKASPLKAPVAPPKQSLPSRRPSTDLSEFAFGVYDLGMQTQAPAAVSGFKKPKSKATTSKEAKDSSKATSKPRKKKAKSEAVILNSDDPTAEAEMAMKEQSKATNKPGSKASKPKKKKSTKTDSSNAGPESLVTKHPVRPTEQDEPGAHALRSEKSAYFSATLAGDVAENNNNSEKGVEPSEQPQQSKVPLLDESRPVLADLAAPRRTDWTPVRNTEPVLGVTSGDLSVSPSLTGSPKMQLTELLGNFGYVDSAPRLSPVKRTDTGEAHTKRRRVDLGDTATTGPVARQATTVTAEPSEPKEKKKAAGRKKLQTITSLATAAYQPALEKPIEQSTVSEFFAPTKEIAAPPKSPGGAVEKPKKPSKPRKKKAAAAEGETTTAAKPKKAKKVKVRSNEADHRSKLYSPARATAQIVQQDFLFGTSSQLAVDESPAFIRDMQAAVQASEMDLSRPQDNVLPSQMHSSEAMPSQLVMTPRKGKSCASVPTAPHGTCLSLEQARRELWCVSSRDHEGGLLRDPALEPKVVETDHMVKGEHERDAILPYGLLNPGAVHRDGDDERSEAQLVEDLPLGLPPDLPLYKSEAATIETRHPTLEMDTKQDTLIDLSHTSPMGPKEDLDDSAIAFRDADRPEDLWPASPLREDHDQATAEVPAIGQDDDETWMLISSDGPESTLNDKRHLRLPTPSHVHHSMNTVPALSPSRKRDILQPLDANAGPASAADGKSTVPDQIRAFSATATNLASKSTPGKTRGRPRKDSTAASAAATSPKKRGRPPKRPVIASDPSPEAARFKRPQAAVSDSQPLHSPSDWLDVDAISDSDSPVTPSPLRRRASTSPSTVPALDITVDGSPLATLGEKVPAVISATSTFKPDQPQWPSIRDEIFPKISATIKDAPRGTDSAKPSWYQKILMYDPVTLEELTGWLNEQGMQIQVRKQKPKAKKKGRKKRDADGKVIEDENAVEWEMHEEPLQPWMVQKWCEERSICCVWAGGGWGGRSKH